MPRRPAIVTQADVARSIRAVMAAALEGAPKPAKAAKASTLAWALDRYRNSSAWAALANATRRQRENVFRAVITTAGTVPLKDITADTIRAGRERRASTPHAANNF